MPKLINNLIADFDLNNMIESDDIDTNLDELSQLSADSDGSVVVDKNTDHESSETFKF